MEDKMKKLLKERFQKLAGIKPLYEQDDEDLRLEPEEEDSYRDMVKGKYSDDDLKLEPEDDDFERDNKGLHPTEVYTDEELDMISDMLGDMFKKLNINTDLQTDTQEDQNKVDALFDFIDGYFETLGGTY
jgi:hypothetical protein